MLTQIIESFILSVPAGRVTITNAKNESSSSVYLSWLAPPADTIFGEFLGYRISYKPRARTTNKKEIYIRDNTVTVSNPLLLDFKIASFYPLSVIRIGCFQAHCSSRYVCWNVDVFNSKKPFCLR